MLCCCIVLFFLFLVFFFKQKTAYEMRISDWSSDVCSSDLFARVLCPADKNHWVTRCSATNSPTRIIEVALANIDADPTASHALCNDTGRSCSNEWIKYDLP